jgi:hypothetical protein
MADGKSSSTLLALLNKGGGAAALASAASGVVSGAPATVAEAASPVLASNSGSPDFMRKLAAEASATPPKVFVEPPAPLSDKHVVFYHPYRPNFGTAGPDSMRISFLRRLLSDC